MGLHSDYFSQTRTNILSQEPLSSLDRAYQLAIQDERVRQAKQNTEEQPPDAVGFALRTNTGKGKPPISDDKSVLLFTYCKKQGHLISGCFELKGFPEWWPNPSKRSKTPQSGAKGRNQPHANATTAAPSASSSNAESGGSVSQMFTAEQWKAIAGFVGNTKIPDDRLNSEFDNDLWIVDTGVSRTS
ncbi:uncharacterized protein LOC110712945 [Chenopodium quinoa]|uniref:uncharacterized protein LOC110712945 n=1 Tax=Chenopodium quinoa TaxID=63459 RepID=UPI000B7883C0|nr:uncharacterized protein LOC110712945 [Chenopodium quinoa]